ncbi:MAG: NAD(P) transhydrogenase subunit alpha, partial [Bryobacteraceae bacterium]
MNAGVPGELYPGERRVALTPRAAADLIKSRTAVFVQAGAGSAAGYQDHDYEDKGCRIVSSRREALETDLVLQVRISGVETLRHGQSVIGFGDPLRAAPYFAELAQRGVTSLAMELIPRITRAQSMDALSSMATIAGYKALLLAAASLPRLFPMLMTAAGTITPARVLVIGAGVAGLQAIATARRLGAVVSAYDVRPAVREQIESLGARFVSLALENPAAEEKSGYARAMGQEFYRRQRELLAGVVREHDAVIATAAVPGVKAPLLISREAVTAMAPGSVVVDLAAEAGGNCELTVAGRTVVESGVTIIGAVDLPSTVPFHASQLYA